MDGVIKESFQSRVKEAIVSGAIDYEDYFVNYDYLLVSDAFVKNKYYIVSAVENNYLHLTGVDTLLSPKQFFDKCISSGDPLQETDFFIEKNICTSLPDDVQKALKKKAKGNIRRKIQALPNIKGVFHNPSTLVEEDFVKNRVHCTIAAKKDISTIGFIRASTTSPCSVKPNTLLKEQSLSPNAKPITLALRRKKGSVYFEEIIIGDEDTLHKNLDLLCGLVSPKLLKKE